MSISACVVAPHMDDETIGCGGTVAKWSAKGWRVSVVWVSEREAQEQRREALAAVTRIGIERTISLGLPEVGIEYNQANLKEFVRVFRLISPQVLLIPHRSEDDRQHVAVFKLADEASWLAAYPIWPELGTSLARRPVYVLEYEVWSPIERPSYLEDITLYMGSKLEALREYRSQLAIFGLDWAVEGLNRYRGATLSAGCYAEAFHVRIYGPSLTEWWQPRGESS